MLISYLINETITIQKLITGHSRILRILFRNLNNSFNTLVYKFFNLFLIKIAILALKYITIVKLLNEK